MRVRGVHDQHVDPGVDQHHGAHPGIAADADGRPHQQPAVAVLGGQRVLLGLDEVLDGDQPGQPAAAVDHGQLLDLVAAQQAQRRGRTDTLLSGDQRGFGHHLGDLLGLVDLKPHVTVGDDAHQRTVVVDHRQPGDPEPGAQRIDLGQGVVRPAGDGIGDHAGLGSLHHLDLAGLLGNGQVAVQHPHATRPCHRDGHTRLGDGVHRRADQWHLEPDLLGELAGGIRGGGHHVGSRRQQQDVVECQPQHRHLVRVVAAGGHRVSSQAAHANVRADHQVGAVFQAGHATGHRWGPPYACFQ